MIKHTDNIIIERIEENPVIAAVKNVADLDTAINSQVTTIFVLQANIFNIRLIVDKIKASNKSALIHIDFLEGIGKDNIAIDYIVDVIRPDGIISTKSNHIRYAKEKGMFTIQRFFLVDGMSYRTTIKAVQTIHPDMIEIMPGVMPKVMSQISRELSLPIIAGGLISTKEDIIDILKAGAMGASVGKKELWVL